MTSGATGYSKTQPMPDDSVTYDDDADRHYAEFSPTNPDAIPEVVVLALAEIRDDDPVELPPLETVVDTDALASIFHPADDPDACASIRFEYAGYLVTVHDTGAISFDARG